MKKNKLLLNQLENKLQVLKVAGSVVLPASGWVNAIRTALGMSLQQLAKRLSITKQSLQEIEKREKEGTVTLKTLSEVAAALDMKLVYGFIPNDGSLDALIERKAHELAYKIVQRASATMKLEDQGNSEYRVKKAIEERTEELKQEVPKILWD